MYRSPLSSSPITRRSSVGSGWARQRLAAASTSTARKRLCMVECRESAPGRRSTVRVDEGAQPIAILLALEGPAQHPVHRVPDAVADPVVGDLGQPDPPDLA